MRVLGELGLAEMIEGTEKGRVKKRLMALDRMISDLLCDEQVQRSLGHYHLGEDAVFYLIEGRGSITADGQ